MLAQSPTDTGTCLFSLDFCSWCIVDAVGQLIGLVGAGVDLLINDDMVSTVLWLGCAASTMLGGLLAWLASEASLVSPIAAYGAPRCLHTQQLPLCD